MMPMSSLFRTAPRRKRGRSVTYAEEFLEVDGVRVRVLRKNVKSITMRIKPPDGTVEVSAPRYEPLATVEKIVRVRRDWIERTSERVRSSVSAQAEGASKAEIERWRAQIKQQTPPLVEKWERILGVSMRELAFRNMKSRWGSCQPATGRVCINIRLALFPPECLEYVVVHELCHLLVSGHGPQFRALLDEHLPEWRKTRALLR